jgi:protein TonB
MSRLALRPSVLASVILHAGALVGATAFAAGRGVADRDAVVLAFEAVDLGAAFDAPEVATPPPPDELRIDEPVVVEPTVAEPPLPPDDEAPRLDETEPVADDVAPPLPVPSPTARAQRAGAAQVTTLSRAHPTNRPPRYPDEALRAGWQGVAWLLVEVGPDGRVTNVALERSSGHAVLDAAAVEAVAGWTYDPRLVDGVPAPDRLRLPVRFTSQAYAGTR